MPEIPTRGLVRGARLAAVPAALVGRTAVGVGRRLAGQSAERIAAEVQERTAEQLFAVLGQLKGGAMKAGQWLSAMEAALPEQLSGAYGEALARLQEAAPAMPARTVHRVLGEELGPGWRRKFREFDDRPAAAASIGQVHRAVWRDGTDVAVKVQYPGAGEALAADLRQLDRLGPLLRVAAPGLDARGLFAVLRAHVLDEVDHAQEAAAQSAFADVLRDDAEFVVPSVLAVHARVLVTHWVGGTPLAQVARSGGATQRRQAALLLARFQLSSPTRVGRLHGDPHPGNFRLLADGRLEVIDFGSTHVLPRGWPRTLGALVRAGRDRDAQALYDVAVRARLVRRRDVAETALLEFVDPLLEPLRVAEFPFTRTWLRAQTLRSSSLRGPVARVERHLHIPVRHLLVQRVAAGTVGVLCLLGAAVPVKAEAERWGLVPW